MKFSYRIILLLTLGALAACVFLVWFNFTDQKHLGHPSQDFDTDKILSQKMKQKPFLRITTGKNPSGTQLGNQTIKTGFVGEVKTDFNTYDILNKIDIDANLLKKTSHNPEKATADLLKPDDAQSKGLKIIVVPHSHNDPGWIKTIDGYFEDQTKHILNYMVEKLLKYPKMTFIWAESVFLSMWWKDLNQEMRQAVRQLIKRRQLEIVGGGWVVTDEANSHYSAIVDQMIEGHQWLRENIGVMPQNSWSLDPFGYSSFLPYLYKRIGFSNAVILRVHVDVKSYLQQRKALEFFWRQTWDTNNKTDFQTLMMPYMLYNIKFTCGPDQDICLMFDFRKISGEMSESRAEPIHSGNIDRMAKLLLGQYQKKASLYRHGVVLIPVGDDFRFDRADEWDQQFKNYMMLFNYINANKAWNVDVRFGTLQDYFEEVSKAVTDSGKTPEDFFPTLAGDFFPYTDRNDEYWTGYFTTRPFNKILGRDLEVYLRAAEILHTLSLARARRTSVEVYDQNANLIQLDAARKQLSLFQHHDGITGTSTIWVANDNENRLYQGLHLARSVINSTVAFLLGSRLPSPASVPVRVLDRLSARVLSPSHHVVRLTDRGIKVIAFNPIAQPRQELIQIAVNKETVEVLDSEGKLVTSQVSPLWNEKLEQQSTGYELSFLADFPPLGIVSYDVIETAPARSSYISKVSVLADVTKKTQQDDVSDKVVLKNDYLQAHFSVSRGQLLSLNFGDENIERIVNLKLLLYTSRRSGAYIFAPEGSASNSDFTRPQQVLSVVGPVFSEIRIKYAFVTQVLQLVNSSGPVGSVLRVLNVVDMTSHEQDERELIMRFDTSVKSQDIFYTDQNAFHTMKRRRLVNLPLEANYYPASSVAFIEDNNWRFSVITSQPVGASSLKQGSIEMMLDRRLKYDDNRGVGAGVQDNKIVLSRFYILPEQFDKNLPESGQSMPSLLSTILADSLRNYPILATSNFRGSLQPLKPMKFPLPCDTSLVNLKTFTNASNVVGLILHKQGYSSRHKSAIGGAVCIDSTSGITLSQLFSDMQVREVVEASLSFMHVRQKLDADKPLGLDPMELYAYKILYK